jgi:hypothetical protein
MKRSKVKKLTPLPRLMKKAQEVFNKHIRKRDSEDGYFTCISCSRVLPVDKMNAGHYVPVRGCSYLRLHEWNNNGECEGCNCFDEFHLIGYRKNLIEKIGVEAVEWLELNRHTPKKYTRQELEEIIEKYK